MRLGRRRFLQAMFGGAVGIALGDEILDTLDKLAPRPVMVGGADLIEPWYSVTTNAQVNEVWRKAHGQLVAGYNFIVPEFKWAQDMSSITAVGSGTRYMSFPVDIR